MASNARLVGQVVLPGHRDDAGGTTASVGNASPTLGRSTGLVGCFGPQARKSCVPKNSPSSKQTRSALDGRRLTAWTFGSAGELGGSSGLAAGGQGTVMLLGAEHFRLLISMYGVLLVIWCST